MQTRVSSFINEEITEGETIEQKINRIVNNKEPIKDGAPLIYTDRKDGVGAQYNIKTDRFEIAIEAMDKIAKSTAAKRNERINPTQENQKTDGRAESIVPTQDSI